MSIYQLALLLSIVGGYLIGGSLWDRLGATGFHLISILYLLGMSVIWLGVKEAPQRADAHRYTLKNISSLPGIPPSWDSCQPGWLWRLSSAPGSLRSLIKCPPLR